MAMTREEAHELLFNAKFVLLDMHIGDAAGHFEDAHQRVLTMPIDEIKLYARYFLPCGRRGRVTLVLATKPYARAIAMLCGILLSIDDHEV